MRHIPLLLAGLLLAGCEAAGWVAAGTGASLAVMQRTPVDAVVSLVTGKDCSIARSDRGQTYCREDPAPQPQPYCTRSLGTPDCWTRPDPFGVPQREIADGPRELSPEQEANRTSRWPKLF